MKIGYLEQEPQLDTEKDVRGNVLVGVAEKIAVLDRHEALQQMLENGNTEAYDGKVIIKNTT